MLKSLHINPDKCTGCMQCEMACSYENYGVFNTSKSRIKVFDFHHEGRKVPYPCTRCAEAWCLHACPVEAIKVDKGQYPFFLGEHVNPVCLTPDPEHIVTYFSAL